MTELVKPRIFDRINDRYQGGIVSAAVSGPLSTTNYSRLGGNPWLDDSFGALKDFVGTRRIAVPRDFNVSRFEPSAARVHVASGHGYRGDETNPNAAGLGLFTTERGLSVATTWADAPSVLFCDQYGSAVGAVACLWQELRFGPIDEMIRLFAENANVGADALYAFVTPGARTNFVLDDNGRNMALAGPCEPFRGRVVLHDSPQGWQLDLTGMVIDLLMQAGVPATQIEVADGDTMATPGLPSKRRAEGKIYPSGIAAIGLVA